MPDSVKIDVDPKLLRWAIERSGYDPKSLHERIAERFGSKYFTRDYLDDILEGKRRPGLTDIKKIDSFLKRGIPFYFISFIPKEHILTEYRRSKDVRFSPKAELQLRKYNEMREELKLLLEEHEMDIERKVDVFDPKDDPSMVADHLRDILIYNPSDWKERDPKQVFEYLRSSIEKLNLFVFKDNLVEGMRGCVFLGGNLPSLILVKSDDDKNGEIFTLVHEFSHYLLESEDVLFLQEEDSSVERWCNEVTASFLMNRTEDRMEEIEPSNRDDLLSEERIMEISRSYKLSKNAIMLKYLHRGIIREIEYRSFLKAYSGNGAEKRGGGGNYHYTNRDRLSDRFMDLVRRSYSEGMISLHDTMEYLNIKDSKRIQHYIEAV